MSVTTQHNIIVCTVGHSFPMGKWQRIRVINSSLVQNSFFITFKALPDTSLSSFHRPHLSHDLFSFDILFRN